MKACNFFKQRTTVLACEFSERFKNNNSADNIQIFASGNDSNNNKQWYYVSHIWFQSVHKSSIQKQVKHLRWTFLRKQFNTYKMV